MNQYKSDKSKNAVLNLISKDDLIEINRKLDQLIQLYSEEKSGIPGLGDWILEKEARNLLGKKGTSLWKLRKLGKLKYTKVGGKTFYSLQSIRQLIETGSE
jgi:hypothetical protein